MSDRRVLVTGSRNWPEAQRGFIERALSAQMCGTSYDQPRMVVVHGACPTGVDQMASEWVRGLLATSASWPLIEERHPADWTIGKAAGFMRNNYMAELGADICLAFNYERSHGAAHCAAAAMKRGIEVIRWSFEHDSNEMIVTRMQTTTERLA